MLNNNTISVVANESLDKTTTEEIVNGTDINEAYIYRFFQDKDDLLAKTFAVLEEDLVHKAISCMEVMYMENVDFETRC